MPKWPKAEKIDAALDARWKTGRWSAKDFGPRSGGIGRMGTGGSALGNPRPDRVKGK